MRSGRVSFQDDPEEDSNEAPVVIRRPTSGAVKSTRPSQKVTRGLGVSSSIKEKDIALSLIRDLDFSMDIDSGQPLVQPKEEEEERPLDEALQKTIAEAKKRRQERKQEELLEGYISLETTTHKYLEHDDLAFLNRSGRPSRGQKNTWEDPEMEEKDDGVDKGKERIKMDLSSGSDMEDDVVPLDDHLDQEAFESYTRHSGRIRMQVEESTGMDFNRAQVDQLMLVEDEETLDWELQQIKKGFASSTRSLAKDVRKASRTLEKGLKQVTAVESEEEHIPLPTITLNSLINQLNHESRRMEAQLDQFRGEISQVELHMAECRKIIDENSSIMQSQIKAQKFYSEMSLFISQFDEMVTELMPMIDSLEQEWSQSQKDGYVINRDYLLQKKAVLFEDVESEFSNPEVLMERLASWRASFSETYEKSYVDLTIVPLMEIFLRFEMVGVEPFGEEFDLKHLYSRLLSICGSDPSAEVKNRVLLNVMIPRMIRLISDTFNILDDIHLDRLEQIIFHFEALLTPQSRQLAVPLSLFTLSNHLLDPQVGYSVKISVI